MSSRLPGNVSTAETECLPRKGRIAARHDFLRVQSEGQRVHTKHFVLVILPTDADRLRLGITVSRRVGNAVLRNRVKRLVREVFRRNRALFPPAGDLVVVARAGAGELDYAVVRAEISAAQGALRRSAREPHDGANR